MSVRWVEELVCWQLAMALHAQVAEVANRPAVRADLTHRAQLLDAAADGARNIAEGFGRFERRELQQFFRYAMAALIETETLLQQGRHCGYVQPDELPALLQLSRRAAGAARHFMLRTPGSTSRAPHAPTRRRAR